MKLDSLQALRAVAAVAVVTHHIKLFGNGAWGVDVFFVISGFIMCYVTQDSGRDFLLKRAIRVIPLYWAGTLAVFALSLAGFLRQTQPDWLHLTASLAFIPYGEFPVMFLGWTLNYEIFFYVLFAGSMAISHRHRAVIASGALVSLALLGQSGFASFYTDPIILEFAMGMAVHAIYASGWRPGRWWIAGLGFLALLPFATDAVPLLGRPVAWGVPAMLAVLLLLDVRVPRLAVALGDASYSLYLFHPYVLYVVNRLPLPDVIRAGAGIVACCVAALLLYRWAELPATTALRRYLMQPRPRVRERSLVTK